MAESADHNRTIAAAAKKVLAPLGCKRKGTSRLWFDDQAWWVTLIEFQPSSWSKGSYLNIGAMWLWNAKAHWLFDDGYRVDTFHQFENEIQFSGVAERLAQTAAEQVLAYRKKFPSLAVVAQYLDEKEKNSIWDHYHAAIALGLSGASERAAQECSAVLHSSAHAPWVVELHAKTQALFAQDLSAMSFSAAVREEIAKARMLLKLPPLSQGAALWP